MKKVLFLTLAVAVFFGCSAQPSRADSGALSVTITPPLTQLSIGPGESWTGSLKVVNNNPYEVSYYASVVDMQPSGEDGGSKFIPIIDESQDPTQQEFEMARWVQVSADPLVIEPDTSADLPFTINIPTGAEPGGHYAAILVGTQPAGGHATGTVLKVSSYVSSLLFVKISGNVIESGRIREFITSQSLYQTPNVDFSLRFENTGNTHVRPEGQITIFNMWGKQRGVVPINEDSDTNFGNVLPQSIRHFQFSWTGDSDPFDIGLYSANVTLAYGDDGRQNVSATTYFWVVPVVPVAIGVGTVLFFILLFMWLLRRYIRRALLLEQRRYGITQAAPATTSAPQPKTPAPSIIETLIEPVREGVIDLRNASGAKKAQAPVTAALQMQEKQEKRGESLSVVQLVSKYKLFLVFLAVVALGCIGIWLYFTKVLVPQKSFQISDVHIEAEGVPSTTGATK